MNWRNSITGIPCFSAILAAAGVQWCAHANDFANRLQALTPDYAAPSLQVLDAPGEVSFVVSLLGVSLEQGGKRLSGEVPTVNGSSNLNVLTYWRANVRLDSRISGQFNFWDHLGVIRQTSDIRIGPTRNESVWEAGGVYLESTAIDMQNVAGQFSGQAWLSIAANQLNRMHARQLVELNIAPIARESALAEREVAEVFGADARFIAQQVRLGFGASTRIEVPEKWRTGNHRLGIVSSMSYRAPDQNALVCRILVRGSNGVQNELSLISGVNTALCNFDMIAEGAANHEKAVVFSSRDSGVFTDAGTPGQLHTYYALFDLPGEEIDFVSFECSAPTILDINGVVLLP